MLGSQTRLGPVGSYFVDAKWLACYGGQAKTCPQDLSPTFTPAAIYGYQRNTLPENSIRENTCLPTASRPASIAQAVWFMLADKYLDFIAVFIVDIDHDWHRLRIIFHR